MNAPAHPATFLSTRELQVINPEWRLTPMEASMFNMLITHELVTKEAMYVALYPDFDTAPMVKILDVAMCKIRKKVKSSGIEIETLWGRGWRLDPASRALVK